MAPKLIKMKSITEGEKKNYGFVDHKQKGPVVTKDFGDVTFLCHKCETPLMEGVEKHTIGGACFYCWQCGALNATWTEGF